jgi:hypothetical protein
MCRELTQRAVSLTNSSNAGNEPRKSGTMPSRVVTAPRSTEEPIVESAKLARCTRVAQASEYVVEKT